VEASGLKSDGMGVFATTPVHRLLSHTRVALVGGIPDFLEDVASTARGVLGVSLFRVQRLLGLS